MPWQFFYVIASPSAEGRNNPGKRKTNERLLRHFVPRNDKVRKQCVTNHMNEYTELTDYISCSIVAIEEAR